jgi:micrococcal nuclease
MYTYKIKKVNRVIDGDTIEVQIDLGFDIVITQRVRLQDIDAPEVRTLDLAEKKLGLKAKKWLEDKISHSPNLIIKTTKDDKYGRILGTIFADGETVSLNETMLNEGLVDPYLV